MTSALDRLQGRVASRLLGSIIAVVTVFWAVWTYANVVAELHGFQNPFIVLGAVVLASIVLFFATAILLAILGITPQETS